MVLPGGNQAERQLYRKSEKIFGNSENGENGGYIENLRKFWKQRNGGYIENLRKFWKKYFSWRALHLAAGSICTQFQTLKTPI